MPAHEYGPGDDCSCDLYICNPNSEIYQNVPIFVVLDVYGIYFFAPSFSEFDQYMENVEPGLKIISVLPEFPWPEGAGSASGIRWYGAMTNAAITELFGELGIFEFGWHE